MKLMLTVPFVSHAEPEAVKRLRQALNIKATAVRVLVIAQPEARERDCYANVRDNVAQHSGKMQQGWAVWQHGNLFIEAEPHAVFNPSGGGGVDGLHAAYTAGWYQVNVNPNDGRHFSATKGT